MTMSLISGEMITNPKVPVRDKDGKPLKRFPHGTSEEEMMRFKSRFPHELLRKLQSAKNGNGSD
jgi:hypothetical protein